MKLSGGNSIGARERVTETSLAESSNRARRPGAEEPPKSYVDRALKGGSESMYKVGSDISDSRGSVHPACVCVCGGSGGGSARGG